MSDLEVLFLVLALIYGWECLCWVRRGAVAFLARFSRDWQMAHPGALFGNQHGGFTLAYPLPPLGSVLLGNQLPLSLSTDVALAWVSTSVNPSGRPAQSGKSVRFDDMRDVQANGKKVQINGEVFLKVGSPQFALHLAEQLRKLSRLARAQREAPINELFRASLDTKLIEKRWQEFRKLSKPLRWLCNAVFVYLFVAAPLAIHFLGLKRCWLELVTGLLALTVSTALCFRRAHRTFYAQAEDDRFTHFLTILLAPASTIRALDVLSRPLLEPFHPLAVARVFCPDHTFREFARKTLLDLRYPALPVCPSADDTAVVAELHSRQTLLQAVEQFLKKGGVNVDELTRPPEPADETCRSYCPRCGSQFTTLAGQCADCGGLALQAFPTDSSVGANSETRKIRAGECARPSGD